MPQQIASKRVFTYEYTHWLGRRQEGLPDFQFPHSHPFNSLPLLRASVACGNDPQMVERIFRFVPLWLACFCVHLAPAGWISCRPAAG
jgi:hypothetical protein